MKTFQDVWLEKVAGIQCPVVESVKEEKVAAIQINEVKNNPKPVMVVAYNPDDSMAKMFIEKLDKVLMSMNGLDRLEIKALNTMKERNSAEQLSAGTGINLYKRGKLLGSLGPKSTEQDIRKFMESHKKDLI